MSKLEITIYVGLAVAAVYLTFVWSTASGSFVVWEVPRTGFILFGIAVTLWSLVPYPDETLIDPGSRASRRRQLLLGLALALAAILSPLPFDAGGRGHHLLSHWLSSHIGAHDGSGSKPAAPSGSTSAPHS
jgi:hypothetical protein